MAALWILWHWLFDIGIPSAISPHSWPSMWRSSQISRSIDSSGKKFRIVATLTMDLSALAFCS